MKTLIVYAAGGQRYRRALGPGQERVEPWRSARLMPASVEKFYRMRPDMSTSREITRKLPEHVSIGADRFYFERGKVDAARAIPADYVDELDALDSQITHLERQRREITEEAYRRGRPLRRADFEKEKP